MRLKHLTNDGSDDKPLSYLFIETVLCNCPISEDARFGALMAASLAKLRNFITPGASSDLVALLSFLAPTGGGATKLKQLVDQAKSINGSLSDDDGWWTDIFNVCGLKDKSIQDSIRQQVSDELTSNQQQTPNQPTVYDQQQDEYDEERDKQQKRRNNKSRLERLQKYLSDLNAKYSQRVSESVFNAMAVALIKEGSIKSSLKFVGSNMMRRFGSPTFAHYSDDDWFKTFMGKFSKDKAVAEGIGDMARSVGTGVGNLVRNVRTYAANPQYTTNKLNDVSRGEDNQRGAKLAVQLLFSHLKKEASARLGVAGFTLKDLHSVVRLWDKLHAKYRSGSRDPKLIAKLAEVYNQKLKPLVLSLNPELAKTMHNGTLYSNT